MASAANARLAANPALAQQVLYEAEYAAGQSSPQVARMFYGHAVERLVARTLRDSPLALIVRHTPNRGPDFVLHAPFERLLSIDITTAGQIAAHVARGDPHLRVVIYERPSTLTVFP